MSLRAENLHLFLGQRNVVNGVNLDVREGEILGLIGPNGAGKSTLLRGLAGLLVPGNGTVLCQGQTLLDLGPRERAKSVAFVAQDTAVAADITALDLVLMGRYSLRRRLQRLTKDDFRAAQACLKEVGLFHLQDRPVLDLSGGERQLLHIARALAQGADTLLLDEPTSALDIHHRLRVFSILTKKAQTGASIAVVLHDLDEAARHCDRLAVIHEGRLHAIGPPHQVLTPQLLAEVYRIDATLDHHAGYPHVTPLGLLADQEASGTEDKRKTETAPQ